jgi:hypothetical protein
MGNSLFAALQPCVFLGVADHPWDEWPAFLRLGVPDFMSPERHIRRR